MKPKLTVGVISPVVNNFHMGEWGNWNSSRPAKILLKLFPAARVTALVSAKKGDMKTQVELLIFELSF